ncbi:M1 family metallopeptidase [Corallococcus llansteffanensis]|uniref:Aminopeptidase n=1 Tax=Corallococcus llansteffanensis TaxID=2316731 RepID=A0A3A8P124_9BACT|nr:M1 family metallopeptidase [Corallococcus llansteffanensis]RKH49090.1 M1 family peptidase [Corallococcus llansteffanensis]
MPNLLRPVALAAVTFLAACGARQGAAPAPGAVETQPVSAPAAQAAPTPPALRLPDDVRPTNYAIVLKMDPKVATFEGTVDIALDVKKATQVVWLHGKGLIVKEATVEQGGVKQPVKPSSAGEDFLGLSLEKPLVVGGAKLHLVYTGTASERETSGAFRVNEGGDWYVYTQFEPLGARRAFPSFDEPGFKVPWQLTFHVPEGNVAVTNTPQLAEEAGAQGWRIFRFAPTQPLPSYLIAFGVGPFDFLPARDAGQKHVKTRIITPRGRASEGAWAAKVTPDILERLEAYFGIPYAFEKLDVLAVPLMGGAMENPGLVTFNSRLILAKPEEDSVRRQRAFASVQVHELAHQWFGDLVTMAWWDDLWLNESFASWMEPRIVETWQPTWDAAVERVQERNGALDSDSAVSARFIRQPIRDSGDIQNAFDGITYGKGSAVLAMTEAWLGRDVFQKGIQRYLRAHAGRNATAKDFLTALSEESGKDVAAVMNSFLDQTGAPFITATLLCDGGKPRVGLSQQRYVRLGSKPPAPQLWKVPVCVKYPGASGKDVTACTLMTEEKAELALTDAKACPAWVFPNADGAGYYRVRLAEDTRAKLMKAGLTKLSRAERVVLLGDSLALAQAGVLPSADALSLLSRVAEEPDRQVLEAGLDLLTLMSPRMLTEAQKPERTRFIRDTFGARARKLGFKARPGESEDTRLLRPRLLELAGNEGEDPKLIAEARALADQWLKDRRAVDVEVVDPVLSIAAKHDPALGTKLREALRTEKDRFQRQQLLGGLGNLRDAQQVEENLKLLLDPQQDIRENLWLLFGASRSASSRPVAYGFVKTHYDALVGTEGKPGLLPEGMDSRLTFIGMGACDAGERQDLEAFFGPRSKKVPGAERHFQQALENVDQCLALKEAQGSSLQSFLSGTPAKPVPAPPSPR